MAASNPRTARHCRPIERRPPMLKDFLRDDAGVRPEQPPGLQRSRSRSRAAADATISAFQKLLSAVKSSLPLPAVKSPSKKKKANAEAVVQVRVKDILRWQSFRDVPRTDGGDEATCRGGGGDLVRTGAPYTCVGPTKQEGIASMEDEEQKSPVSVLEWSSFRDDEEPVSAFDETLANVERTRERLLESIKRFEGLACVDEIDEGKEEEEEEVNDQRDKPLPNVAQLGMREEIEECVRDIEREAQWGEFVDQQRQLGFELEVMTLNALLDELLFELIN